MSDLDNLLLKEVVGEKNIYDIEQLEKAIDYTDKRNASTRGK